MDGPICWDASHIQSCWSVDMHWFVQYFLFEFTKQQNNHSTFANVIFYILHTKQAQRRSNRIIETHRNVFHIFFVNNSRQTISILRKSNDLQFEQKKDLVSSSHSSILCLGILGRCLCIKFIAKQARGTYDRPNFLDLNVISTQL